MKIIEIYEPPLCCPTGVCGPAPDPDLAALQETILKLKKAGFSAERIALNQQPKRFMNNPLIKGILNSEGKGSLPITLIGGKLVLKGRYPKYEELIKEVI
jgi:hypothetical protein